MTDAHTRQNAERLAPVVVVGALGMLGRAWCEYLTKHRVDHLGLDLPDLNITDAASIKNTIPSGTRTIVNCAAFTDVDAAETHEADAMKLNADAVRNLAEHAREIGATLIHYSTDYVFDGQATSPYPTDHPRDPINAYGRTKAQGEQALEASGCRYLLIRTSWLYAPWANNFVLTMLRLTRDRDTLKVVNDQRGRPTSAQHLAEASFKLLEVGCTGTFHVTDGGECSWHEFACEIARLAGHVCDIHPRTSDEFPRPAKRPAYSVLDLSQTEQAIGPMPDWRHNLAHVLRQLEPQSV
ncbi:MAG: dTDP-4-dehydrorhamnose reductase [Phycisphaeraceae bacterium]